MPQDEAQKEGCRDVYSIGVVDSTDQGTARAQHRSSNTRSTKPARSVCLGARDLMLTALVLASPVQALQLVEASDGTAAEAVVSTKEPTRLRIEGAPITDVFGNIHSSQCAIGATPGGAAATAPNGAASLAAPPAPATNPAGDVSIACDRDKGEIYLRPVGDSVRPINLFVSSATATYTLLLRRADTPADTIVIRDKTPFALRPRSTDATPSGPAPSHVRAMKAMLVAMASDRIPPDIRLAETRQPLRLWAETSFVLVRRYEGRGFIGEKYLLQNIGGAALVLAEQEFDRPDSQTAGQVAGVAVEHHNLRPGESTNVYVLRRGGQR